jgi:hypothetical protein
VTAAQPAPLGLDRAGLGVDGRFELKQFWQFEREWPSEAGQVANTDVTHAKHADPHLAVVRLLESEIRVRIPLIAVAENLSNVN